MRAIFKQKKHLIALLMLATAAALLAHLSWQGEVVGLVADDAVYLLLADYFSPYSHQLRQGAAFVSQHGVFPPAYPLFLSLLGADSYHVYYAHVLTTLVVLGALWACARYLVSSGSTFALAAAYLVVFFLLPRTLLQHVELLSEPLYLLLSMLALAKYQSLDVERDTHGVYWIAVFVCLATLTRAAGVALLFAFIFWQCSSAGKNRVWSSLLLAIVPLLIWEALKVLIYAQPKNYSQDLLNTYGLHDADALIRKIAQNFSALWTGWRQYIDVNAQFSSLPASILLPACALPALIVRLKQLRMDAIYFVLYLAMILMWPYPDHTARFLYPVIPLALFYVLISISWLHEKKWRSYLHGLTLGLTILAAAPSTVQILHKSIARDDGVLGNYGKTLALYKSTESLLTVENNVRIVRELTKAMQISGKLIPEGECVYATHFEMFMFFGKRYSRPITDNDVRNKMLANSPDCRYLFVNWSTSHPYIKPGYPLNETLLRHSILYEHLAPFPSAPDGMKGLVAQLVELLPTDVDAVASQPRLPK